MNKLIPIEPEYVYVTIPAEYICVYHRILAMLADYGEEMLKDCKATCTDKNSGVIECFNMFNSAVAARKLGKTKLAELIIKYVKAKINHIYKTKDNSTSFVFPVDENGQLKAFVSCGERPRFEINPDDMNLYEHKLGNGFDEHFHLGKEDESKDGFISSPVEGVGLFVSIGLIKEIESDLGYRICADTLITYYGELVSLDNTTYQWYVNNQPVNDIKDILFKDSQTIEVMLVVTYMTETKIVKENITIFNNK